MSVLGLWKDVADARAPAPKSRFPNATLNARDHARVPGRRLHHRAAHRRRDVLRRRARRGWCSSRSSRCSSPRRSASPICTRSASPTQWIAHARTGRADLPRVHPLHRRRRGVLRGRHDARPLAADHRRVVPRLGARSARAAGGADDAASAPSAICRITFVVGGARRAGRSSSRFCPTCPARFPSSLLIGAPGRRLRLLLRHRVEPHRRHHRQRRRTRSRA